MALKNDGQKYKKAFSIGRRQKQDASGMEDLPTTLSEKGPPSATSDKGLPTTPSNKGPHTTPFERGPPTTPSKERHIMKLLNKKPESGTPEPWPPIRPFDNVHPSTQFGKWPPLALPYPTERPLDHLPPFKPLIEWKHEDPINDFDLGLPKYKFKFVFVTPTEPPLTRAVHIGTLVFKVMGGAVGFVLLLMMISSLSNRRKHRNRRGVVPATDAGAVEQDVQTDRRPNEPGEPGLLNNDLPPPYYEFTAYSKNKCIGEEPPPYTDLEEHKQRLDAFTENERRACSEGVAPEIKTELVFDNGRIVDRLSLDLNSNNNETETASNVNVEEQSTRHEDLKDGVVYIDETGNVKGNSQ